MTDFDKLLAILDADRDAAGAKYEALRARLVKFFEWRNCVAADELADTVFDRVVAKIANGEAIQNPNAYAAGVAQFVFKEYLRDAQRRGESLEERAEIRNPAETAEDDDSKRRFDCLDKCLAQLDAETRRLLIAYHDTDERTMIATRKRLAVSLAVSLNTLRIRVCRQKAK